MRKQTEVQDRLMNAQAAYDQAKDDLDGLLTGRISWAGTPPTTAEIVAKMERAMLAIHLFKWMLGLE